MRRQRFSLSSSLLFALVVVPCGQCLAAEPAPQAGNTPSSSSKIPAGVILVKGAVPSASGASLPLPESGSVAGGSYRNDYFGFSYQPPAGWSEQAAGPPPSNSGNYVLTQFAMRDGSRRMAKANVLVSALDLLVAPDPSANELELLKTMRDRLAPEYEVEFSPEEVTINGHRFARFGYQSRIAGLHWRVMSTEIRCHAVVFTFAGSDKNLLDAAVRRMDGLAFPANATELPHCVAGYAAGENVLEKVQPRLTDHHFNTIPARIIIDREGHVRHVHLLSAFPEQSEIITAALLRWRFKPAMVEGRPVEVETGIVFGVPSPKPRTAAGPH